MHDKDDMMMLIWTDACFDDYGDAAAAADDDDIGGGDDIYIMMKSLCACHEKSSLPTSELSIGGAK